MTGETTVDSVPVGAALGIAADGRIQFRVTYPRAPRSSPLPVAIVLNGFGCGPELYLWLARRLAAAGMATVTYSLLESFVPDGPLLYVPGSNRAAAGPDADGTIPLSSSVGPLLESLAARTNATGEVPALDLDRVGLIGHSGGGAIALRSAAHPSLRAIQAVACIAAHAVALPQSGWPVGGIPPLSQSCPTLIIGGDADAVIGASAAAGKYGDGASTTGLYMRTYDAVGVGSLVVLAGGGHFAVCEDYDAATTLGNPPGDPTDAAHRPLIGDLVATFLASTVCGSDPARHRFRRLLRAADPRIALGMQKPSTP